MAFPIRELHREPSLYLGGGTRPFTFLSLKVLSKLKHHTRAALFLSPNTRKERRSLL
jgi:hypothetical protein